LADTLNPCSDCRLYSGCGRARLWRALPLAAGLTLALAAAGCSINSSRLDSIFASADQPGSTGSIAQPPGSTDSITPPPGDLAYARAAATDLLARGRKDDSAPWENPNTGARGTITPIASAYTLDGQTCRDFLASYVSGSSQSWMQGEACKQGKGIWEVRALKPWKRS
jgi:17 kDa outer membrane surface antigen